MPQIQTLIPDIYTLIQTRGWFDEQLSNEMASSISSRLRGQFMEGPRRPSLRLSQMAPTCPCALWHSFHRPELAEAMPPWAEIKFSFGHVLEALAIGLAKAAGHEVCGEQDELELDGIIGHRDCVIDGCTVDVKSASSLSFEKYKNPNFPLLDSFGYLDQLDGYVVAAASDPLVRVKDKGYILAIDKTLGHMYLYEHRTRESSIRERIRLHKEIVSLSGPPRCTCETVSDGASGNIALGVKASYNKFKFECFPHLRTFLYSKGPRYLTRVVRKPDVVEIDRTGKIVYN